MPKEVEIRPMQPDHTRRTESGCDPRSEHVDPCHGAQGVRRRAAEGINYGKDQHIGQRDERLLDYCREPYLKDEECYALVKDQLSEAECDDVVLPVEIDEAHRQGNGLGENRGIGGPVEPVAHKRAEAADKERIEDGVHAHADGHEHGRGYRIAYAPEYRVYEE